jgi:AraC-like DNA-binding protein
MRAYTPAMTIDDENQRVAARHLERLTDALVPANQKRLTQLLSKQQLTSSNIQLPQLHHLIIGLKQYQPDITLRLFQQLTLSDFGLYGYACASANTLQEAIDYSVKFMALSSERYQELQEHEQRQGKTWVSISPISLPSHAKQMIDIDEDFAAGNYRLLEVLLEGNVDWRRVEIHFAHRRPGYGNAYDDFFQCRVKFEQAETKIRYPASWLQKPISHSDGNLAENCLKRCFDLLEESDQQTPWSDKIRRLIIEQRFEINSLNQAAEYLHLMPRTLREYLYREKNNFRELLLEARMTLAKHYLQATAMSGEEISYLLRYSQPSVFFRAFEKYFGATTKCFRN